MIIGFIIAVAVLLFDQVSKLLAENLLVVGDTVTIIPGFLKFSLVHNPGAGFSFMEEYPAILTVLSLIASILIGYFIVKKGDFKNKKFYTISLAFLLGGCVGNLVDRFLTTIHVYDGVIDFIQIYFGSHLFLGTTDNIADIFLVVGIIMLFIDMLILDEVKKKKENSLAYKNEKLLKEKKKEEKKPIENSEEHNA